MKTKSSILSVFFVLIASLSFAQRQVPSGGTSGQVLTVKPDNFNLMWKTPMAPTVVTPGLDSVLAHGCTTGNQNITSNDGYSFMSLIENEASMGWSTSYPFFGAYVACSNYGGNGMVTIYGDNSINLNCSNGVFLTGHLNIYDGYIGIPDGQTVQTNNGYERIRLSDTDTSITLISQSPHTPTIGSIEVGPSTTKFTANHYNFFGRSNSIAGFGSTGNLIPITIGSGLTFSDSTLSSTSSMVYPSSGIPLSTGSGWGTSITDNSSHWNTAYGWGNHASAGYFVGTSSTIRGLLSATSPIFYNNSTGVISSQAATSLVNGYLTSTDWSTFNGKFNTPSGTTAQYLRGDGSISSFPSIPSVGTWGALNYPTWSSGTPFVKMTAAGTFSLDNSTYLTGNQSITLSGDVSGSGTTTITTSIGSEKVTNTMLAGSIDLTTKVTGVLPIANGGMDPSLYCTLMQSAGTLIATNTANTFYMSGGNNALATTTSGTANAILPQVIYISSSDYPTINGLAPKLRIRVNMFVNHVAPTGTWTFGLYPITASGSTGGAGLRAHTIGTLVSGSNGASQITPSADTNYSLVSADFALPSNGLYVICVTTTATLPTASFVQMNAMLQIHNH